MRFFKNQVSYLAIMAMVGIAAPQVANAQVDDQASDEIEDVIIVTARARAESIQEVPIAITAFDQEAFIKKNIQNLDDVARLTPGLSFEDFTGGFATPVIRGQSQTRITSLEQNVSTFLDGVYIPRSWAIDVGTLNLDRIEVVKGPQSARYGRNAFAGAINYVPFKARLGEDGISGTFTGTIGSDERYDGGIKVGLSDERIAAAFSYDYSEFDGTWDNEHPFADIDLDEGTEGNIGGWENEAFSASVAFQPVDSFTLEASWNRFDVENEARAGLNNDESAGRLNCGSSIPTPDGAGGTVENFRLFCGELPDVPDDVIVDPRSIGVISETEIFRFGADWDISDSLNLNYTFGAVDGNVFTAGSSESFQDTCFPNFFSNLNRLFAGFNAPAGMCAFTNTPIGAINYDSHELRLVYNPNETLLFELGGFVSDGRDIDQFGFASPPPLTADPASQITIRSILEPVLPPGNQIETDVNSVFAAIEWTGFDGALRLGAEARYTEDDITGTDLTGANAPQSDTFDYFTPRFSADYQWKENSLIYASAARGVKTGGFNPGAIQDPARPELEANLAFDPETNWTFEIGSKNQFFDNRAILNAAVFYTDWNGLQLNAADPGGDAINVTNITLNLGDATVFGVELDGAFDITDKLSVDASFSYVDNEYDDGTIDNRFGTPASSFFSSTITGAFFPAPTPAPCDDILCSSTGDIGGNQIERTPDTQFTFGAEYNDTIPGADIDWFVRGDLSWQSEFFVTPVNLATIPDRTLISASAGLTYENVDLNFWVRNLTDEEYVSNSFAVIIPFGNAFNTFFGDRRSFGATAKYNF